ncbi:MAG: DHA2 family efflux MFS transporter permease subunit [Candidatus Eremiobacteraeota bacterium]|nr:DHA2 family efflux MFS transporter permease subunit [Candidatus Eremiobacteraeota bacterium]
MAAAVAGSRNGVRPVPTAEHYAPRDVIERGWRRTLITLAIVTATLLEIVDVTIVNVALPNIQGNFGASVDQAAWIGTGYIIANVIVIPITPWLQQRFGRRQYYATSIIIFIVASMMCGLSGSLDQLVFWRIVQGLGGGGLISTSQAILRETYPPSEQGKAAGIFSMGVIVGPTLGPTLGGIITDQLSWRWAFFVNLVPGLIAVTVVLLLLRNPERPKKLALDYVGLGLLAVGIGSLQYVLDQGQQKDWFEDTSIVLCSLLAGVGLGAFLGWEIRQAKPVVNLGVLRHRSVSAGSILGVVLGISLYGSVLILPQYVQGSLGFTATLSGELLVFRAGSILLFTPLVAYLASSGKIDARLFVCCGFVAIGVSNFMLAAVTTPQADFWSFFLPLALSGVGLAQIFVPLTMSVLSSVEPREIPAASAMFNLARQLGGSVAIAVLVTVLARANATHHTELGSSVVLARGPVSAYLAQNGGEHAGKARGDLNRIVTAQAAVLSYADTARIVGAISLVLAPLAFLLKRPKRIGSVVSAK